ncbi:MAG: hypothetical protein NC541_14175 [bacterium]|nr:hypothetical protein [bacterium]
MKLPQGRGADFLTEKICLKQNDAAAEDEDKIDTDKRKVLWYNKENDKIKIRC